MARIDLRDRLPGVHVVMTTPFRSETELDEEALRYHTQWLIEHGVRRPDGVLIPGGSVGECNVMTVAERKRVMEIVIEEARGQVPVVPACNDESARKVIDLVQHAERLGADGVMLTPTYYTVPTDEQVLSHFRAVSDATSLGIMIYNNQLVVGRDLPIALLDQLADIPNVAWIKDCTPSFHKLRETVEVIGDRIGVVNCYGVVWEPYGHDMGCCGFISDEANFVPEPVVELYRANRAGDTARSLELYRSLRPIARFIATRTWPARLSTIKEGMRLRGLPAGDAYRLPHHRFSHTEHEQLTHILVEMGMLMAGDR
ncbi:MAG: dihydrodipicolinate synthase family protein [Ardenticatenaceae bacterium]|nr:dihydrodipicolinate synthase family protein [Ardenticatenaceae bacterium]